MPMWIRRITFAFRTLRNQPANTLLSFLAFAVGIGLCTAMFNILSGMVLRGLPFPDADRLYNVSYAMQQTSVWRDALNYDDYLFVREHQSSFEELAAMLGDFRIYADPGRAPEQVEISAVSHEFFAAVGVEPIRGRVISPEDDRPGAPGVALISHRMWTSRYNADDGVLGRVVEIENQPTTLIGVLPPGFSFPWNAQVLIPLHLFPGVMSWKDGALYTFGRLKADRSLEAARSEMATLFESRAAASVDPGAGRPPQIEPLAEVMGHPSWNQVAWVMIVAVVMVLAIACLNVANLRLVRTLRRTGELGVRLALGASGRSLVGLVLLETALLTLAGAVAGIGVAHWSKKVFESAITSHPDLVWWRYLWDFSLDGRTLFFTTLMVVASCLAASTIPVWFILRGDGALLHGRRSTESRSSSRLASGLVICQLAFTFLLLTGAGLMIKSILTLNDDPLPYDPDRILLARVRPHTEAYQDPEAQRLLWRTLVERARTLPGVESVSLTSRQQHWASDRVRYKLPDVPTEEDESFVAHHEVIDPGYFQTLGAKILEGRALASSDTAASLPVAVVNAAFAERNWPGQSAVGKTFLREPTDSSGTQPQLVSVVGVVEDLRMRGVRRRSTSDGSGFYVPYTQSGAFGMTLQMRIRSSADETAHLLRENVLEYDPDLVVSDVKTIGRAIWEDTTDRRLVRNLFALFGGVSVFLASLGIYGIVSASVARRRRELGVRMAMGARRAHILMGVFRQSFAHLFIGLVVGLGGAILAGRFLGSLLYRVSTYDVGVLSLVGTVLAAVALLAATFPAYRASRVDPVEALRED